MPLYEPISRMSVCGSGQLTGTGVSLLVHPKRPHAAPVQAVRNKIQVMAVCITHGMVPSSWCQSSEIAVLTGANLPWGTESLNSI